MTTPHNAAKPGEIAKTVLMAGDPLRAKFVAETYLEDIKCYNEIRGMLGFTGLYKGKPVSVQGHGMGMPSIGIYTYELYNMYDVDNIIRIGSAGPSVKMCRSWIWSSPWVPAPIPTMPISTNCRAPMPHRFLGTAAQGRADCPGQGAALLCGQRAFFRHLLQPVRPARFLEGNGRTGGGDGGGRLVHERRQGQKNALCMLTISDEIYTGRELPPQERQVGFTNMMEIALELAISL